MPPTPRSSRPGRRTPSRPSQKPGARSDRERKLREIHRAPGGKQLTSLLEVSGYDPDRAFALQVLEGALPIDARLSFEPTDHGTRLTFAAHGQPNGPLRLAQPLLRRSLERQFAGYCATLKRILETEQSTA